MTNQGKGVAAGVLLLVLLGAVGAASAKPKDQEPDDDLPPPPEPEPDGGVIEQPIPGVVPGVIEQPIPSGPVAPVGPVFEPEVPDIDDLIKTYPTGGTLYQAVSGDLFGGTNSNHSIAYRLLLTEAFRAAKNVGGLDDDAARSWAKNIATKGNMRAQMITIIQCAWWNDILYGTWGYGPQAKPGPHGRAIRLLPYHPNNRQLIADGIGPARNIQLKTPNDAGKPGSWNGGRGGPADPDMRETWELLLMPKINEEILWNSDGTNLTTEGMTWSDGSSMGNVPPPWVQNMGIGNYDNAPTTLAMSDDDWGCD